MQQLETREARQEDIEEMIQICEENLLENNQHKFSAKDFSTKGFLMTRLTKEDATKMISDKDFLVMILKDGEKTVGYSTGCDIAKIDEKLRQEIFKILAKDSQKVFYHRQIAKSPKSTAGAHKLLSAICIEAKKRGYEKVVCRIIHQPFFNQSSISFHEKSGFEKIAIMQDEKVVAGVYLKRL